jgi:hypothetical protein
MSRTRTAIATAVMIATALAVGGLPGRIARAGEAGDVQELRREVSRMRAEVQAMQVAIMQANELERQRTARLTKALEEQAAVVPSDPAPPSPAVAPGEGALAPSAPAAAPQIAPASGSDKAKGASRRRHHKRSGRSHTKGR